MDPESKDDRIAEFVIALRETLDAARRAALRVELRTRDGHSHLGVPGAVSRRERPGEAVDISDRSVAVDDVVVFSVASPGL